MDGLTCNLCGICVGRNLLNLSNHMRQFHGLAISHNRGFKCGQNGCELEYRFFSSLQRHISLNHAELLTPNEQADGNVNDEQQVNDEDVNEEAMAVDDNLSDNEPSGSSDEDNEEDNLLDVQKTLSSLAADIILKLRSNNSVTGTTISLVLDHLSSCFELLKNSLKEKVTEVVNNHNVDEGLATELSAVFHVDNPFEDLDTLEKQMDLLQRHVTYVKPETINLGSRLETVRNSVTDEYIPKLVRDTCQYVPIKETLKFLLSDCNMRDLIFNEEDSENGFLEKYRDGNHFKNHPLFSQQKLSVQLQISYDDVELTSALGSKTVIHKVGAFYLRILNLPEYLNSSLHAIHMLLLCYTEDMKKYGFRSILAQFLRDIRDLEVGVEMTFGETQITVYGTIASVCGDGLAVHELYNLLGPSAKCFCRLCRITRPELLSGITDIRIERTRLNYEEDLERVNNDATQRTETGIKGPCPLNELQYFHIMDNYVFDAFHDFHEGVTQYEIKLVLDHHVRVTNHVDVDELNRRIHSFVYGDMEVHNKPSANFSRNSLRDVYTKHTLSQRGAQIQLLLKVLPFLLSGLVPKVDPHMKLLLLLSNILDIVLAPRIHLGSIPSLEILIHEHNRLFKELFPEANMINKHHHIQHYPQFIEKMGPPVRHWCMRYEGKHNELSRHGSVCCNFKNLPKTMARLCQMIQSRYWGKSSSIDWHGVHCDGGKSFNVAELACAHELIENFDVTMDDRVFLPKKVTVHGSLYRPKLFVVMSVSKEDEEGYPSFGRIQEIFVVHGSLVVLSVNLWKTVLWDDSLNAYRVEEEQPVERVQIATCFLGDHRAIAPWSTYVDDHTYLCPKTAFF